MPVAYQFANATNTIPLSQLDANFASPITLGNTSIQLGNSVSTLNNMTLANVTISSGNIAFAIPATSGGTGLVSPGTTGNVLTSNGTAWVSTGVAAGSGVTALSFGSTGLTPSTSTSGNVTVAGTLAAGSGGTGLSSPGTTGNVLTSNGSAWVSSAPGGGGGGAMTLISTQSAVGVVSVSWTGLSGYNNYLLILNAVLDPYPDNFLVQIGTGSTTWVTSNYNRHTCGSQTGFSTAQIVTGVAGGSSGFVEMVQTSGVSTSGYMYIFNINNAKNTTAFVNIYADNYASIIGAYRSANTSTVTGIRLISSNGTTTFTSGTLSLYGISS